MKNARGGMDAFPFLLCRFSAWEALAGGGFFCPSGPEENEGPQWDIFLRLLHRRGASPAKARAALPGSGTWAKSMAELA